MSKRILLHIIENVLNLIVQLLKEGLNLSQLIFLNFLVDLVLNNVLVFIVSFKGLDLNLFVFLFNYKSLNISSYIIIISFNKVSVKLIICVVLLDRLKLLFLLILGPKGFVKEYFSS
jgi:hypothetical protein